MKSFSAPRFGTALRNTLAATFVTLAAAPAVFAQDYNAGLQKFLAQPVSFVAISEGAPGSVTFASMMGSTLAVQFLIPSHSGDTFGEYVGEVDDHGVFVGNSVLIRADGQGRAAPVTMVFEDDGTIVATLKDGVEGSGFVPNEIFHGY